MPISAARADGERSQTRPENRIRFSGWREFVHAQATRLGVPLIDLVEDYRKIPAFDGEEMFTNPFHPSHYNPRGNAWAAKLIHDRLVELPAVRAKLAVAEARAR